MAKPKVDPEKYLVKVPGGWAVLPFDDGVAEGRHTAALRGEGALDVQAAIRAVSGLDVSVVWDQEEWAVWWTNGSGLTPELLENGGAFLATSQSAAAARLRRG